jgi:hypothetical protein
MNPAQHYLKKYVDLYKHIDDAAYVRHQDRFASWYERPIDLPGRVYLQVVDRPFKQNQFARDEYVAQDVRFSCLPARRRRGRYHIVGAGFQRQSVSGHAKGPDRKDPRARRPHRFAHESPIARGELAEIGAWIVADTQTPAVREIRNGKPTVDDYNRNRCASRDNAHPVLDALVDVSRGTSGTLRLLASFLVSRNSAALLQAAFHLPIPQH